MSKEIIRNTGFLLGSPNFCPPFLSVSLSPLAGGVMEKGPKLDPKHHWGFRQTLVLQKNATIRSWCHWCMVWSFISVPSGSQKVSQRHEAERMVSVQSQACAQATETGGRQNEWVNVCNNSYKAGDCSKHRQYVTASPAICS